MHVFRSFVTALGNLRANPLRTALTMLGVIIGVSAVIVMVSIMEGARARIVGEFERLGSNMILIAYEPDPKERREAPRRLDGLKLDDVRAIQSSCDLVASLSAEMPLGEAEAHARDRETKVRPSGIEPDYRRIRNLALARGRFITKEDADEWAKVCVVGTKVAAQLFPGEEALGRDLELRGVSLTVVGVLEAKGRSLEGDGDRQLFLPLATVQKRFLGSEGVGMIFAQPRDPVALQAAMDQIWECLMRRHDNASGFRVDSQENILKTIGRILTIFGLVLGSIAGLALLVGGIGIMNIMLVSVTERTREIGIRKAVGARRRDILWQFLIEAASVSGLGGLVGIALGGGVARAVGAVSARMMAQGDGTPGIPVYLPLWAVLGAFLFSAGIGIFFGLYPAARAARLDPIEALRHE
jgi:putative ABC transport system permease protein